MTIKHFQAMNGAGELVDCIKFTSQDGGHLYMPADIPLAAIEGLRQKLAARIAARAAGTWIPPEEPDPGE